MKIIYNYDVLVIGAGPAGLSAARMAARAGLRTGVYEKLRNPGDLSHPCGAVIAPLPGFVSGQRTASGLNFPELALEIPNTLIRGTPTIQRYISPNGHEFHAEFPARADFPVTAIDKSGLLRLLAERAAAAGADLHYGTLVTGLIEKNEHIIGVKTREGDVYARLVISAEGISRQFCEEAGLYEADEPKHYAVVAVEELDAPNATAQHVGQLSTFGRRYTTAPNAFGTVEVVAPGQASVYFAMFSDTPAVDTDESLWYYLDEYRTNDPRVREMLAGATVKARSGCRMMLRDSPTRAVRNGFIGVGDAVTPGGHLGILASMYLGVQAAQVGEMALRLHDTSAHNLEIFNRAYFKPILRGVEIEGRIMRGLTSMSDEEIDRVCETLHALNLAPYFFGSWRPIVWETVRWAMTHLNLIARDQALLMRLMRGAPEHEPEQG